MAFRLVESLSTGNQCYVAFGFLLWEETKVYFYYATESAGGRIATAKIHKGNRLMKILVIALLLIPIAVNADCLLTWNANPTEENVTSYIADIDGIQVTTAADDTNVLCSEFDPPVDETVERHVAVVYAVNEFGRSEPSNTVPFGQATAPVNVSVQKQ